MSADQKEGGESWKDMRNKFANHFAAKIREIAAGEPTTDSSTGATAEAADTQARTGARIVGFQANQFGRQAITHLVRKTIDACIDHSSPWLTQLANDAAVRTMLAVKRFVTDDDRGNQEALKQAQPLLLLEVGNLKEQAGEDALFREEVTSLTNELNRLKAERQRLLVESSTTRIAPNGAGSGSDAPSPAIENQVNLQARLVSARQKQSTLISNRFRRIYSGVALLGRALEAAAELKPVDFDLFERQVALLQPVGHTTGRLGRISYVITTAGLSAGALR